MRAAFEYETEGGHVGWLVGMAKYLVETGMDRGVVKEFQKHRNITDAEWHKLRVESIRDREEYKLLVGIAVDARRDSSLESLLRNVYPKLEKMHHTERTSNKAKRQAECLEQAVEDVKDGRIE
jgi:hypothetical protein